MALTRSYKETILAELQSDAAFRKATFEEAVSALLDGEQVEALSMLRDLVHATITFKRLAEETGMNEKSLHRMLGPRGNPTMRNIGLILHAIQKELELVSQVRVATA